MTGAECVWTTVVPFSVQMLVKVVKLLAPVVIGRGAVVLVGPATTVVDVPLYPVVIGSECVCTIVVPFSVQRLVNVV